MNRFMNFDRFLTLWLVKAVWGIAFVVGTLMLIGSIIYVFVSDDKISALYVPLIIIGSLGTINRGNTGAQWAIGALLLVFACVYNITVGPVCYAIVAEIPSTRLRQKTVVLARNFYNLASVIGNVLTPRMLNPGAWVSPSFTQNLVLDQTN